MTYIGPTPQHDVMLPTGWSEANRATTLLFRIDGLELHLIPGSTFETVADAVGTLRESTYRQQLFGSGNQRDLDGRDTAYDPFDSSGIQLQRPGGVCTIAIHSPVQFKRGTPLRQAVLSGACLPRY